jgi:hypothetical protein
MKKYIGKFPSNDKEQIGNSDCKLNSFGKFLLDITEQYVHAIRCEDTPSRIEPNTMYVSPTLEANINVIGEVNVTLVENVFDMYESMIYHLRESDESGKPLGELYRIDITNSSRLTLLGISILLEGRCIGYYLPDINSWIVGNWTWHKHYITFVLAPIWPQIVEKLKLTPCENSIAFGRGNKAPKRIEVSIGADPELETTRNGKVINAKNIIRVENYTSTPIGLDGAASQLEFRPKPGTPQKVVQNIRHLVKQFSEQYPDVDLTAAGNRFPLGGHIHAGVGHPIEISSDLINILDDFIGRPTINLSGNARTSYKHLSAVRSQPHGFEYRTTPAAVFQNPRITHIVFLLMKNLCEKYFNQDTLEYNDIPTAKDYITVGGLSENQAKYFLNFCKDYKPDTSIRAAWKVPPASMSGLINCVLTVEFNDSWNVDVQQRFLDMVNEQITSVNSVTIDFYGLSRERGSHIATIYINDVECISRDNLPKPIWRNNTLHIGFSSDIRSRGLTTSQQMSLADSISELINAHETEDDSQ